MTDTTFRQKIFLILSGIFLFFILLEISLRTTGFLILSLQEQNNRIFIWEKGDYRILCVGESTTAWGGEDAYPQQLERILTRRYPNKKISVINKGITGIDTEYIVTHLPQYLDEYKPNLVIVMMGINDVGAMKEFDHRFGAKVLQFLKSCRIYKLSNLLRMHIVEKSKGQDRFIIEDFNQPQATQNFILNNRQVSVPKSAAAKSASESPVIQARKYYDQGNFYLSQLWSAKAEVMFKKALLLDPSRGEYHLSLGGRYLAKGDYERAEKMLKKAIELSPANVDSYLVLARCYARQNKFEKGIEALQPIIEKGSDRDYVNAHIGAYYDSWGDYEYTMQHVVESKKWYRESEKYRARAVQLTKNISYYHYELGSAYQKLEKYDEFDRLVMDVLSMNSQQKDIFFDVIMEFKKMYIQRGELQKAEELLKKSVELDPLYDRFYYELAAFYEEQTQHQLAHSILQQANKLKGQYYNLITKKNYQRLSAILRERKTKWLCVQYPLRELQPLKSLLQTQDDVIFVDNERTFKDIIKNEGYENLFSDRFAGDFGHCTKRGNRLLADNIAHALEKAIFHRNKI